MLDKTHEDTPKKRLILIRKVLRKSQSEFASMAKVSVRTYQRIEHGETAITVPFLFQLCDRLGLDLYYFFADDPLALLRSPRPVYNQICETIVGDLTRDLIQQLEALKDPHLRTKIELTEDYCDCSFLNSHFQKTFDISIPSLHWSEGLEQKEMLGLFFDTLMRLKDPAYFLIGASAEYGSDGKRTNIALGHLDRPSWDNPRTVTTHVRLDHLAEDKLVNLNRLGDSLRPHLDRPLFVFPHIA